MARVYRSFLHLLGLLALALIAPGCAAPQAFDPVVTENWNTHTGQLMYRAKGGRSIIGEFVVRESSGQGFVLHFSSGPGIPLMKLQKTPSSITAEGVLARGKWRGGPESVPRHLRGWVALEELFGHLPTRSTRLSGNGWTAQVSHQAERGTNVDVTMLASGERFVFHFGR
jgi:hypothetical protein